MDILMQYLLLMNKFQISKTLDLHIYSTLVSIISLYYLFRLLKTSEPTLSLMSGFGSGPSGVKPKRINRSRSYKSKPWVILYTKFLEIIRRFNKDPRCSI